MRKTLKEDYPELALEWSDKNAGLSPDMVTYGSNKIVWWNGKCGHEWQASIKGRSKGEGCPYCAGKRVLVGFNDFRTICPDIAAEWSDKNADMNPTDFTAGSQKKVWWKGKCGHEWKAVIKARARGAKCPYCSARSLLQGFNDLATLRPDIAAEWSDRNLPLTASDVMPNTNKKVWWKCEFGHEWNALISSRNRGTKCPFCSGIILLDGFNDLATTHVEVAKEWSDKNLPITPNMVNAKSRDSFWWECSVCGYSWSTAVYKRARGDKCPQCLREEKAKAGMQEKKLNWYKKQFETRYPWLLLKYCVMENNITLIENDTEQIGLELQFYFPDHNLALEISENFHQTKFGRKREVVKNRLCKTKNLKMVRILEMNEEKLEDCICIQRCDRSSESLDDALNIFFRLLDIDIHIDSSKLSAELFRKYICGEINI